MKPTKKSTRARRGGRASHFAEKRKELSICPKCKKTVKPHHACSFCGTYKGKQVLKVKSDKKTKK